MIPCHGSVCHCPKEQAVVCCETNHLRRTPTASTLPSTRAAISSGTVHETTRSIDHMRNCLNVWQHSVHCHLCCVEIPLLFVNFVALSITAEAYCSPSSFLTHTCELRVHLFYALLAHIHARRPAGRRFLPQSTW